MRRRHILAVVRVYGGEEGVALCSDWWMASLEGLPGSAQEPSPFAHRRCVMEGKGVYECDG
jgi:hypothetical protein